jgi:hypothetical protein
LAAPPSHHHSKASPMNSDKLALIASIILECVEAEPDGCPEGPMYTALMPIMSLEEFTNVTNALVTVGKVRRSNHCLFPARK